MQVYYYYFYGSNGPLHVSHSTSLSCCRFG